METKKSLDKYSRRILSADDVVQLMLLGKDLSGVIVDDESERRKYEANIEQVLGVEGSLKDPSLDLDVDAFHKHNIDSWFVPDKYLTMDVYDYLIKKCQTEREINRVITEYKMFEERGLTVLLGIFVYLVDVMRENNIVWGVGRGSSVASYCLYLIGIHRIDSIKYDLDITEFLK